MECESRRTTTVILKLDNDEASWLMNVMQNKLHSDETDYDKSMRERFFDNLLKTGI